MLYYLLYPLREYFFGFNVVKYLTFRIAVASLCSFFISLWIGPRLISYLSGLNAKQTIERVGFQQLYEAHKGKDKTPTMGGIMILCSWLGSTLLWADVTNRYVLLAVLCALWLGLLGFIDDILKLLKKNSKGIPAVAKIAGQLGMGLLLAVVLCQESDLWQRIHFPFIKNYSLFVGAAFVPFAALVICGASNAVNLADGLDGLAIGSTIFVALTYSVLSYVTGNAQIANYLNVPYVAGAGELAVFCAAIFGAGMGFLWFNSHPASIFMGDMGSLSIGGSLGAVAIMTKKEFLLLIVGGVFVAEALSVIIQVISYKTRGKRVFLMAPIHHHFQLKGVVESKVVIRMWIVSIILSLIGLASLKLQ